MLSLAAAFWFFTAVMIVCFIVHVCCENRKLKTKDKINDERISRMFYNSVTRKLRQSKRKSQDVLDALLIVSSARGSFEAFERIFADGNSDGQSLAQILVTNSDGLTLDKMNDMLSQQEDFLRSKLSM
jgi:hypothetical protein